MDEFVGVLILLGILVFAAGPIAVIMAIVLFNKLSQVEQRLKQIESRGLAPAPQPAKSQGTTIERLTAVKQDFDTQNAAVQPPAIAARG